MTRKAYSILAVALTTSACAAAASSEQTRAELAQEFSDTTPGDALKNPHHFAPLCDGDGYPLPGNINNKGGDSRLTQFCEAIAPKPPAPPAPTPTCDQTALNQELSNSTLENALTQPQRYRCLCDDKGYPLVGNINAKGTTASAFCGALREQGKL
ncbi:MAG: hypothetical protein HOO96_25930 [Polyangiaceae bacterium]|nr:hypothetical protein [Polyangiaceae bacterium]